MVEAVFRNWSSNYGHETKTYLIKSMDQAKQEIQKQLDFWGKIAKVTLYALHYNKDGSLDFRLEFIHRDVKHIITAEIRNHHA